MTGSVTKVNQQEKELAQSELALQIQENKKRWEDLYKHSRLEI